ncbi:MAG: hypothetical protein IT518_12265 [Burkholderiales bacterium]|nr:hypothetical protein [Burkholderiales bacterium]
MTAGLPPSTAWRDAGFLVLCIAVAGLAAIARGQDANWDLLNYHFYDPWAVVHGRILGHDWVAAQLQTFHNATLDLYFYLLVESGLPPKAVAFALAIPAGFAAFFLWKIVAILFPAGASAAGVVLRIAAFGIGITGAMGWGTLGTTMNEWPIAALVLAALWVLVRALATAGFARLPVRALLIAGFIAGVASGLKLTAATFAVAGCVAFVARRPLFREPLAGIREAFWFAVAVAAGLALAIGWWWSTLWSQFGSPVFPYLNEYFRSPWFNPWPVLERGFGPFTLQGWLLLPYEMFRPSEFFVAEVAYRDARMGTLYTLALVAGAVWLVAFVTSPTARKRALDPVPAAAPWYFLGAFWVAAFLLWAAQYSIYRYILALELLCGALIVGLMRHMLRARALPVAVTILAITLIATTRATNWGHIPFGERWFAVDVPKVPDDALVVLASDAPMAYLLPFMTPGARHVGAYNNVIRPGEKTGLAKRVERMIATHQGPLFSLSHDEKMAAQVYAAHGLAPVREKCVRVETNMRDVRVMLCPLIRVKPG